jgi:beta-galactosidase
LSNIALGEDEYWAYGGSFGDQPNNGYTCINGLFRADRVPNPHFYQVARTYQNIEFTLVGNNKIKLRNKHFFTSLDEFDYSYEWMEGGVIINKGKASLADDILTIETTVAERKELILTIYAHIKQEQPWAEKGFVVAWEQFVVSPGEKNTLSTDAGKPSISLTGNEIRIEAAGSDYVFDAKTGALISWKSNGKEILSGALEPYFWKPANVNQLQNNYNNRLGAWRDAAKQRILKEYRTYQDEGIQSIEFKYDLPVGALYILTYSIDGTGRLKINAHYSPYKTDIPLMPKFGFRAQLSPSYDTFAWYGRGPHENYPDRKSGYMIGRYKLPIDSIMVDYAKPQDNANRCDVRSLSITGKDIPLIKIQGIDLFNFRAWTYLEEDLEKADYPFQLPDRDYINLNIDSEIHGVGGNDGWGARTMDQYTVDGNKERSFEFIIEAI